MNSEVKRLLLTRFLRSLGQGMLVVDFSLYLKELGFSSILIGSIFTFGSLFGAIGSILVGMISDRTSRKAFMIGYTFILIFSSLAMFISKNPYVIIISSILGSFGLGANGAAGPFSPAEQAWLSEKIPPKERGNVLSINSGLAFFGMALGAILAIIPTFLKNMPENLNYRILFLLIFALSFINLFIILSVSEEKKKPSFGGKSTDKYKNSFTKGEIQALTKLLTLNTLNGFAIGLKGPLISYWFSVRFGVGAEKISPVMALTFLITGILSFYTGPLTNKIGIVNSVVAERAIGLLFLIALPLAPTYFMASTFYFFHQVFNRGSTGARQALTLSIVSDRKRGLAVGLNTASAQISRSIGPYITGILLSQNQFEIPFFIAALLQGIYLLLYEKEFKNFNFPEN